MNVVTSITCGFDLQAISKFVNVTSVAEKLGYPFDLLVSANVWSSCVELKPVLKPLLSEPVNLWELILASRRHLPTTNQNHRESEFDFWVTTTSSGACVVQPIVVHFVQDRQRRKRVFLSCPGELNGTNGDKREGTQSNQRADTVICQLSELIKSTEQMLTTKDELNRNSLIPRCESLSARDGTE